MRAWADWAIQFWQKYERRINLAALVLGFSFDIVLARRPDSALDNFLLLSYLVIAGAIIVSLNLRDRRVVDGHPVEPLVLLLILQFCFGGLASNLLVLYGHSGTFSGSALFILLLLGMLLGNEFLLGRYSLFYFNVAVYYLLLLTYCIIAVPTFIMHSVGWLAFMISCAASVVVVVPFFLALRASIRRGRREQKLLWQARAIVGGILAAFMFFYFLNIIPPVPLSIKAIGIYHSLSKDAAGNYSAAFEQSHWWEFWRDTSGTYTRAPGSSAFCFSSVFAPAKLEAPVYHEWERLNSQTNIWESVSRIPFSIAGGRSEGYRGWSEITMLSPGEWRCNVETSSGALIGRISFTVVESSAPPALSKTTL